MQAELLAENPATAIRLLGVNETGQEGGNTSFITGRTIPWLQEAAGDNVWSDWSITYRDLIILDKDNQRVDTYNLTSNSLANAANYTFLKNLLKTYAGE